MITVLVAVDLCDHSVLTIEVAHAIAKGARGRITVLHVVRLPEVPAIEDEEAYRDWSEMRSYALVSAETTLRRLLSRVGMPVREDDSEDELEVDLRLCVGGSPAAAIVAEAEKVGADLIVAGAHERPFWTSLLGSTGRRVSRSAPCPVIIVRSRDSARIAKTSVKGPHRTPIPAEVLE